MAEATAPARERRRQPRGLPDKARAWLVSGEFDDLFTTVNFARRLINVSPTGMCVETTGRLRAGVKMSAEVRFEKIGGTLRAPARIIWAETVQEGGQEIHKAGFQFVGAVEMTRPVREYFQGRSPLWIVATRKAEYEELKSKSEARKQGADTKGGAVKKSAVGLLLLVLCYVGSYWGLVIHSRDRSKTGIHYRYASPNSGAEESLATLYKPLLWAFRAAGVDLTYDPS